VVLYNILIESDIPMKLMEIIKMCLNETCSRVRAGKNLSDIYPIKNSLRKSDTSRPMHFTVALEYAVSRVQERQDG